MNYILSHKWVLLIEAFFLLSIFLYSAINRFNTSSKERPLLNEFCGKQPPKSLCLPNLEKLELWNLYPIEGDLFTCAILPTSIPSIGNEEFNITDYEASPQHDLCSIQLDGWTTIKEKTFFVFSCTTLKTSFLGTVGDSFKNPSFTIISADFRTVESFSNKFSFPLVTILYEEMNEKIILIPASYIEYF